MLPGKGRIHSHHIIDAKDKNDIQLLKSAIVYGANASGKSNLVKAISFAKSFILTGTMTESQKINYKSFRLDKDLVNSPSRIEFEIKHKGKNYAYGFIFDTSTIIEEWLFEIFKQKEDRIIFTRTSNEKKKQAFDFSGVNSKIKEEEQFLKFTAQGTRRNQLFLTECRVRNVKDNVSGLEDILNVIDWFRNALKIIFPDSKFGGIEFELKSSVKVSKVFHEFLDYFNTGIKGIELVDVDFDKDVNDIPQEIKNNLLSDLSESTQALVSSPHLNVTYALSKEKEGEIKAFKMMTQHKVVGSENPELFEMNEESDGTQRIIDFIPAIMDLFEGDNVFIIDEIDRSLHPNLTYDLIDLFLSKSTGINSQLIVTTHESSLLSQKIVRKDEIWFVVKDTNGASKFHSLEEYKVRFDKEIRKDYLLGRYKAVPEFGSRNQLTVLKD